MAATLQTTILRALAQMKLDGILIQFILSIVAMGSAVVKSENGLAPFRWQAII